MNIFQNMLLLALHLDNKHIFFSLSRSRSLSFSIWLSFLFFFAHNCSSHNKRILSLFLLDRYTYMYIFPLIDWSIIITILLEGKEAIINSTRYGNQSKFIFRTKQREREILICHVDSIRSIDPNILSKTTNLLLLNVYFSFYIDMCHIRYKPEKKRMI